MNHPNFPQDSVLSRHFDSRVAMQRDAWLKTPPSDSTLRRHNSAPVFAAASPSGQAPRRQPARASTIRHPAEAAAPAASAQGSGFFGWLFGLFGRRA